MTLEEFEKLPDDNDGWVEWPTFDEDDEEMFDWSLSYEEMERRYPPNNFYKESQELKSVIVPYNTQRKRAKWWAERKAFNYKQSTSFPPTVEKKREEEIKRAHYLNYMGKDCPCVGFIDRAYAGMKQYQNAYYHSGEEKYLFLVHGGVQAYEKKTLIGRFIKPFFPNEEKKSSTTSLPQPQSMSHHQWKNNKQAITEAVKKEIVYSPTIVAEKMKVEAEAKERSLFISHMTMEQFGLMQKHGWRIAKLLTAPEENFHYE